MCVHVHSMYCQFHFAGSHWQLTFSQSSKISWLFIYTEELTVYRAIRKIDYNSTVMACAWLRHMWLCSQYARFCILYVATTQCAWGPWADIGCSWPAHRRVRANSSQRQLNIVCLLGCFAMFSPVAGSHLNSVWGIWKKPAEGLQCDVRTFPCVCFFIGSTSICC